MECHADVAHLHALWMYHSLVITRWSLKRRKPYVISTNGMLDPWALRNSYWKKQLALLLYERQSLEGAACIHVSTHAEAYSARDFGLKGSMCVIPNGVDPPSSKGTTLRHAPWDGWKNNGVKILLYLGRLHPKKGLEVLIKAWSASRISASRGWRLVIVGSDHGRHDTCLRRLVTKVGLNDWIHFLPPMFNELRDAAFNAADAFILPSLSEGLPMAVLSAWASGLPVIMTPECNLPEGFAEGAAIRVNARQESIADGLDFLNMMSDQDLLAMGAKGRRLVEHKFTWTKVAADVKAVYDWILGNRTKPECVVA